MYAGFLHPTTVLAVLVCALASLGFWAAANRPAIPPDYHGTIAGLAFSPFHRGESPRIGMSIPPAMRSAPTCAKRRRSPAASAPTLRRACLARSRRLASDLPLRITAGAWLARDRSANEAEIRRLIAATNASRNIDRVLVGNEAVLRTDLTPAQLIGYIRQSESGRARAGLHGRALARLARSSRTGARGGLHHDPSASLLGRPAGE